MRGKVEASGFGAIQAEGSLALQPPGAAAHTYALMVLVGPGTQDGWGPGRRPEKPGGGLLTGGARPGGGGGAPLRSSTVLKPAGAKPKHSLGRWPSPQQPCRIQQVPGQCHFRQETTVQGHVAEDNSPPGRMPCPPCSPAGPFQIPKQGQEGDLYLGEGVSWGDRDLQVRGSLPGAQGRGGVPGAWAGQGAPWGCSVLGLGPQCVHSQQSLALQLGWQGLLGPPRPQGASGCGRGPVVETARHWAFRSPPSSSCQACLRWAPAGQPQQLWWVCSAAPGR